MHEAGGGGAVFTGAARSRLLPRGFGKELLEVLEEIGGSVEEGGNLRINIRNCLGLPLVGLENFKELFVDLWLFLEAVLESSHRQDIRVVSHLAQ